MFGCDDFENFLFVLECCFVGGFIFRFFSNVLNLVSWVFSFVLILSVWLVIFCVLLFFSCFFRWSIWFLSFKFLDRRYV